MLIFILGMTALGLLLALVYATTALLSWWDSLTKPPLGKNQTHDKSKS